MSFKEKFTKYLDLPYIFLILGVITLIRAFILLDYSNLTSSSFGQFISPILLILTAIFVLKVFRKKQNTE